MWRKLDKYLCSSDFFDLFAVVQYHLNRTTSDHYPIYLDCLTSSFIVSAYFRYLESWTTHPDFDSFVTHHWKSFTTIGGMRGFYHKLSQLKHCLRQWNKDTFGNIFDAVVAAEIEATTSEKAYDSNPSEETKVVYHLSMANLRLEQSRAFFWKQKANIKWMQEGDANT